MAVLGDGTVRRRCKMKDERWMMMDDDEWKWDEMWVLRCSVPLTTRGNVELYIHVVGRGFRCLTPNVIQRRRRSICPLTLSGPCPSKFSCSHMLITRDYDNVSCLYDLVLTEIAPGAAATEKEKTDKRKRERRAFADNVRRLPDGMRHLIGCTKCDFDLHEVWLKSAKWEKYCRGVPNDCAGVSVLRCCATLCVRLPRFRHTRGPRRLGRPWYVLWLADSTGGD